LRESPTADDLCTWLRYTRLLTARANRAKDQELAGRLTLARELVEILLEARQRGVELVPRRDRPPWWRECKNLLTTRRRRKAKHGAGCIARQK